MSHFAAAAVAAAAVATAAATAALATRGPGGGLVINDPRTESSPRLANDQSGQGDQGCPI